MDRRIQLLWKLAEAFGARRTVRDNTYPKDTNPEHWRTINGAHVHIDKSGNYDGGAGGKFNGRHHYGPDWSEKTRAMKNLTEAINKGINPQKAAPKTTNQRNNGWKSPDGNIMKTEKDVLNEIAMLNYGMYYAKHKNHDKAEAEKFHRKALETRAQAAKHGVVLTTSLKEEAPDSFTQRIKDKISKAPEGIRILWNEVDSNTIQNLYESGGSYYDIDSNSVNLNAFGQASWRPEDSIFFYENGHAMDYNFGRLYNGPDAQKFKGYDIPYSAKYKNGAFIKSLQKEVNGMIINAQNVVKDKFNAGDIKWLEENGVLKRGAYKLNRKGKIVYALSKRPLRYSAEFPRTYLKKYFNSSTKRGDRFALSDIVSGVTHNSLNFGDGHSKESWKQMYSSQFGLDVGLATEAFSNMTSVYITSPGGVKILEQYLPNSTKMYKQMVKEMSSLVSGANRRRKL